MRKVEHDYRLNVIKYYKDFSYGARRGSSGREQTGKMAVLKKEFLSLAKHWCVPL